MPKNYIEVTCVPQIETYPYTDDEERNNITSDSEIIKNCISHFHLNFKGKDSLLGHLYTKENWNPDIWNNEIKFVSHHIKDVWMDEDKLRAKIEPLDPENIVFSDHSKLRFVAKICHSEFITRITKIDIIQ